MAKAKHLKQKEKKMGFLSIFFLIIFIGVFVYTSTNLVIWYKSNKELEENEKDIFSRVVKVSDEDPEKTQIDFETLKSINSDVKAWIEVENTNINYPILQTTNNDYYLKHDINKKYSSCGSIFLDCDSNGDFTDKNTVVYGHNLLNGKMFAELEKVVSGELGNKIKIKIYLPTGEEKEYEVFSGYVGEPSLDMKQNTSYDEILKKSELKFEYNEENKDNNLITLITCNANSQKRIVIRGLEIKEK